MARSLPPLNALKAFEAAARLESFTLAAQELNVSHAAVSRHIRELEAWLGVRLFVRTGRGVEPTEECKAYRTDVSRGLDLLSAATSQVSRRRRPRKLQLTVTVEPELASLWLIPRLGRFTAANPGISIAVDAASRLADLARGEADLGIRFGRGKWPNLLSQKLADSNLTPVCSEAFARKHRLRSPADLTSKMLIRERQWHCWTDWLKSVGLEDRVSPEGPLLSGELNARAAEASQGLALADELTAGDALLSGRLVMPFGPAKTALGYYLVRASDTRETKPMSAFRLWLEAEVNETLRAIRSLPPA